MTKQQHVPLALDKRSGEWMEETRWVENWIFFFFGVRRVAVWLMLNVEAEQFLQASLRLVPLHFFLILKTLRVFTNKH